MGGLVTDDNARVLDDDSNPIPGLFAVGNVQGGRFVEDYPFTLSGASHAAALTYGYLTGKYLAEQAHLPPSPMRRMGALLPHKTENPTAPRAKGSPSVVQRDIREVQDDPLRYLGAF